jgi:hypothetical protein
MVLRYDPLAIAQTVAASARGNEGKPKSYVGSPDGATMVEVEPHQYVNARSCSCRAAIPAATNTMERQEGSPTVKPRRGLNAAARTGNFLAGLFPPNVQSLDIWKAKYLINLRNL